MTEIDEKQDLSEIIVVLKVSNFLKRVSEASYKIQSATERNMVERTFRSTFASGQPSSSMFNRSQLRYGGYVPVPNLGNNISGCSTQEASSTNFSMPRFGCTQSLLLCNQGNLKKPTIGNGSAKHPYNHQNSLSLHGNTSGGTGLMTGPNLFEMYQQKNQLAPQTQSFNNGMLNYNSTTSGVHGYNDIGVTGYGKMGAFNSSNNLNLKPKRNDNSYKKNYAGYQMAGDGRLVGLGFKGGEASTNYNSNNFLMNGKQNNESMITMPLLSGNFGDHLAQGVITSNGFQSQGQVSPTTFNCAIQQENNSVIPMPSTPLVQQNSFGNERGESDRFFGLLNNVSDFDSNSFIQPFGEDDLSFNFLNQINIQSPTQRFWIIKPGRVDIPKHSLMARKLKSNPTRLNDRLSKRSSEDQTVIKNAEYEVGKGSNPETQRRKDINRRNISQKEKRITSVPQDPEEYFQTASPQLALSVGILKHIHGERDERSSDSHYQPHTSRSNRSNKLAWNIDYHCKTCPEFCLTLDFGA
ncbi:hypothetical protein HYC85_001164 [Camellia sinensis]|uniref:Uncharacterized protein n=1 Tax=Camellia sinensis TaxID=4442 RepID=A0A7J7I580_CAMSI|nr:hypothetical protein HYC85_001164 [Camellia sinensis]